MAISTLDGLIAALGSGTQRGTFLKLFTPQAAGAWMSLWNQPGIPGAAANPASGVAGAVPTDATAGAFPFTNPTAPALTYLARLAVNASVSGVAMLYDRLWENSGLSPTTTTGQTVNSVALTRPDALGGDVEAWFQVYAAMGAGTGGTMTLTYTDQDGNTGSTATIQSFAGSAAIGRTFPYSLAAGDTGVRSIQTETHTATLTSGTYGLVLRRRVATIPIPVSNTGALLDPLSGGLPTIPDDACLELLWFPTGTTATTLQAALALAQG